MRMLIKLWQVMADFKTENIEGDVGVESPGNNFLFKNAAECCLGSCKYYMPCNRG